MDLENRWKLVSAHLGELLARVSDCELDFEERNAAGLEVIRLYIDMMERASNIEGLVDVWARDVVPEMRAELDKILLENPLPIATSDEA